nr:hypothetical protein [Tanacetum cinerariifolium]
MPMKGTQVFINKWETAPICHANASQNVLTFDAPSQPTYYGTNNINENNVAANRDIRHRNYHVIISQLSATSLARRPSNCKKLLYWIPHCNKTWYAEILGRHAFFINMARLLTLLAKKESDLKAYGGVKEGVPLVILSRIRIRHATGHSVSNQAMSSENVGSDSVHNEEISFKSDKILLKSFRKKI